MQIDQILATKEKPKRNKRSKEIFLGLLLIVCVWTRMGNVDPRSIRIDSCYSTEDDFANPGIMIAGFHC